ncbi:hypothetical protein HC62_01430 [Acetobacter tropicalis]|uniref:Uncharacterized protein n=1 Tax=Acetobacter tropicalis TaxID=104102 RepID=A0A252ABZ0_9PROT|nr:hypothetical protein HC62_01430 [Acetobacter tropicalis]
MAANSSTDLKGVITLRIFVVALARAASVKMDWQALSTLACVILLSCASLKYASSRSRYLCVAGELPLRLYALVAKGR